MAYNHVVILPERWPMGHREKCDSKLRRVLEHDTLDLEGYSRRAFVKNCVLSIQY